MDLFKYDLVYQIIQAHLVDHFTFIPMLTKDHCEEDYLKKAKAGKCNNDLVKFLDECRRPEKRDIKQLGNFFKGKITIYKKDDEDKYFPRENEGRQQYFKEIGDKLPSKSLILVDPDNGLEIQHMKAKEKYVRYEEVQGLYNQMDESSILMIYQCYPRMRTKSNIQKYFDERSEKLKNIAGDLPIYIDDNEIRFFFLTRNNKFLRELLGKEISKYGTSYGLTVGNT